MKSGSIRTATAGTANHRLALGAPGDDDQVDDGRDGQSTDQELEPVLTREVANPDPAHALKVPQAVAGCLLPE